MPSVTAPNPQVLKAGTYNATFDGIEEKEGGAFGDGLWWLWSFEIPTVKGPKAVSAPSSRHFGAKAKARQWATALLGRPIKPGEVVDFDDLIGKPCLVQLTVKEDDGEKFNRIEAVTALPVAAEAAEDDGDDILAS